MAGRSAGLACPAPPGYRALCGRGLGPDTLAPMTMTRCCCPRYADTAPSGSITPIGWPGFGRNDGVWPADCGCVSQFHCEGVVCSERAPLAKPAASTAPSDAQVCVAPSSHRLAVEPTSAGICRDLRSLRDKDGPRNRKEISSRR